MKPFKKKILITCLALFISTSIGLISYGFYLSTKIEKRFSERRWSIPSTIYSDTTLLYPGQRIKISHLKRKLRNLGYRSVSHKPKKKGEMRIRSSSLDIFLNDLKLPAQTRDGFSATIRLSDDRIKSIKRFETSDLLPIIELEPEEIMKIFGSERERRQLVSIKEVPQYFIHAVMAAEDNRFYDHFGFDPIGMIRAFLINIRHGSIRQGGSTITQQLAKNYFLKPDRKISRKLNELILSIVMEIMYDKNEILEIYLNEIYLGQNGSASVHGVGEASFFYFGKSVPELTLTESATIAGLIRAPNYYSPYTDQKRCFERRNHVLKAMSLKEWITKKEHKIIQKVPIKVIDYMPRNKQAPYFMDYLSRQLKTLYSAETLSSLGLSIYTTLDTQVQNAAESALQKGLERLEKTNPALYRKEPSKKLQGGIVVMQPKTGYILAMVGGRNYGISQFNRIDQSHRQPGSAFKPFVCLAGLDKYTPASLFSNEPREYTVNGEAWKPHNFSKDDEPKASMRRSLVKSYNLSMVDIAMKTGLKKIVKQTSDFHFTTPIKPYPSIALGAFEIIPLELARAYCVFAADGIMPYPLSLKDVVDEKNITLKQTHLNIERLISPAKAFIITDMLSDVVSDGTARALTDFGIHGAVAGKTGTTNNYRDAVFVGYTPDILALVWVGFDDGDPIYTTGSKAALPIWADMMNELPQYFSASQFKVPSGVISKKICTESSMLAHESGCPIQKDEYFLEENMSEEYCTIHKKTGILNRFMKGLKNLFKND